MREPAGSPPLAVILAAGRGTRMREAADVPLTPEQAEAADRGLKMLVPIRGRPFLAWALDEVAAAGFADACLVVGPDGPDGPDPVRRAAEGLDAPLRLRFAVQPSPRGSADAVRAAAPVTGDRPFVVLNADNLYPAAALRRLRELEGPGLVAFQREALVRESNIPPGRVAAFALVRASAGVLEEVIEKPSPEAMAAHRDAPVSMTCWRFDPSIHDACRDVTPSPRGELELVDAVRLAMARGTRFRVLTAEAGVLDVSRREDIPRVERWLA